MLNEARSISFNEDSLVVIALGLGAIVSERVLRKYAPAPWNETWRPVALSWGVAAVLVVFYIYVVKSMMWEARL